MESIDSLLEEAIIELNELEEIFPSVLSPEKLSIEYIRDRVAKARQMYNELHGG